MTMPSVSCRHDTIKKINPASNRFKNIGRCTYSHQISRSVNWHPFFYSLNGFIHFLMAFSDSETPDCIAGKVQFCYLFHMFTTDILKNRI